MFQNSFGKTVQKKYLYGLAVLIILIAIRLYLPILVKNFVVRELNKDPEYRGSVADIDLHLLRGAYTIKDLKIERVKGQKTYPLVSAKEIDIGLSWREVFRGAVVAQVTVSDAKINIVREEKPEENAEQKKVSIGAATQEGKKTEEKTWQSTLDKLVPLKIGHLSANNGELHFHDLTTKPRLDVFLDRLHIDAHNLTNSRKVSESLYATIFVDGRAMRSGTLKIKTYLNPLSQPPDLKLNLSLADLDLVDLNKFFTAYGKFDVKQGKFNLYSEIATSHNKVIGYLKPIIKELQVSDFSKDREKSLGHAIWEKIVGGVGGLLKNYSQDQQAAKIPFEGQLDAPKAEVWKTIKSIFHNVFVQALEPKLDKTIKLKELNQKK